MNKMIFSITIRAESIVSHFKRLEHKWRTFSNEKLIYAAVQLYTSNTVKKCNKQAFDVLIQELYGRLDMQAPKMILAGRYLDALENLRQYTGIPNI